MKLKREGDEKRGREREGGQIKEVGNRGGNSLIRGKRGSGRGREKKKDGERENGSELTPRRIIRAI